jgi:hypothetical protein
VLHAPTISVSLIWSLVWYFVRSTEHTALRLWNNVEKYGGAREDADNMGPARSILDK